MAGSSDDGEPHGTAGRPILQVLLGSQFGEICMVVSRWFGGVKLGTGGLVRAYQQAARENLETLPGREQRPCDFLNIKLDYGHVAGLKNFIHNADAVIESESYGEKVDMLLKVPRDRLNFFLREMDALTGGTARIEAAQPLSQGDAATG